MKLAWKQVERIDQKELSKVREELHMAVQLVGAFPRNYLAHDPTDANASLIWNSKILSFESQSVKNKNGNVKLGLIVNEFKLYFSVNEKEHSSLNLNDKSINDSTEWVKSELSKLDFDGNLYNLNLPYEIESYDYKLTLNPINQSLEVFSALYSNMYQALVGVVEQEPEAFDIRCWPHHFDLATLLPIEKDDAGELSKSIGIGFSPGDERTNEPYYYINIWPNVALEILEKHSLQNGYWNKTGWAGALLTYSELLQQEDQTNLLNDYLNSVLGILKTK